jgi:hypothetical protein
VLVGGAAPAEVMFSLDALRPLGVSYDVSFLAVLLWRRARIGDALCRLNPLEIR